ncbi:MAG: carboxymuconolactone decarboxylase family protein [Deltaproteobacteria bacterium]|nr:carboxymuconolactone decarboxylase family protein [Deltaproteobacteria bacterium]
MENEVQQFNKDFTRSIQKLSKESPSMVKGFNAFHDQIMKGGVLSGKEKEFIALGIAIAVQEFIALGIAIAVHCVPCIRLHTQAAIAAGANKEEIIEAASVGVLMAGGPAYTHVPEVLKTLEAMGIV